MGEESSVQRPSSTSSGPRRKGLKRAASETRRQKFSRAVRAPSAPPVAWPSTSTAAFIAPADVPEMPSIPSHGSSSRRSNTPHVNAPCEPPPCNARSTRIGSRVMADLAGSTGIGPRGNHQTTDNNTDVVIDLDGQDPSAAPDHSRRGCWLAAPGSDQRRMQAPNGRRGPLPETLLDGLDGFLARRIKQSNQ